MQTETPFSSSQGPRGFFRQTYGTFAALDLFAQATLLTLPLLLLYVQGQWYVKVPIVSLALAGLLFANIRDSAYFWFAVACFIGAGIYFTWEETDNHKYAIAYWCLSLFFVRWLEAGDRELRHSARMMLAMIFVFATFWKIISPDFMTGEFFQHTFLFDERFSTKLEVFGLLDPKVMAFNSTAQAALADYQGSLTQVEIQIPGNLKTIASLLAWWTAILEGAIALCFLLPSRMRITRLGDFLLIIFISSTYPIAPVIGFGWILLILAIVQCDPERRNVRMSYLILLVLLQLFRLPWANVADSIAN